MNDVQKNKRYWQLTRGTEWVTVWLDNEREVYIHNFSLGYIFDEDAMGYEKYMSLCAITTYIDKPIPQEWSEIEKQKIKNDIVFSYAIFFKTFVKCDDVQYIPTENEFRLLFHKDGSHIALSESDIKQIFVAFREIYCMGNPQDNVPWKDAKPRNKEDEEFLAIMREMQMKVDRKKNGEYTIDSIIMGVSAISSTYNLFNIWDLKMWQLMNTHSRMNKKDSIHYTRTGIVAGTIDTKKNNINPSELSWSIRD